MLFTGKTVLVTGGAIRAGAYICRAFAKLGGKVVIHCLQSRAEADALCAELGGESAGHRVFPCDLRDPEAAANMIRTIAPDILINNAASYFRARIELESTEETEEQYQVNYRTPVVMIRTLAAVRGGRETSVVNVLDAAIAGVDSESFSYSLSKKLLAEATKTAALQCAPFLRVNAIAPGRMIPPENLRPLEMRQTLERLPLKRNVAPEDFAQSVIFLAWNRSMTGSILYVDCGQSLLGNMG